MEVSAALRRIKRQFGDEYNVVINDQDIYDWIYDAELDIIRSTSDNDLTITVPVGNFPLQIPEKVNVKRLSMGGKALTNVSLSQLDMTNMNIAQKGGVIYWYYQGNQVFLYPVPETTSTSLVEVTYARTPSQMSSIAPYFKFDFIKYGVVDPTGVWIFPNDDWGLSNGIDFTMELSIGSFSNDFPIVVVGSEPNTAFTPEFSSWHVMFKKAFPNSLTFTVSNGTTYFDHRLDFPTPLITDAVFKIRITYDQTTNTASMYSINKYGGTQTLLDSNTTGVAVTRNTTHSGIHIGNIDTAGADEYNFANMCFYSLEIKNNLNSPSTAFLFDGFADLSQLPGIPTGLVFNIPSSSGHTMYVTGQNSLIVYGTYEFTVPEVYHEDIVKFCLARAHSKNQNFRAAEAEMEQYDRKVTTRRNEAQAPETTLYKIPDPADYEDYAI